MVQENGGNRRPEVETDLRFGPFRLEATKRLWRGDRVVGIRPRPLAMLRYLAERPGRLVTKEELLKRLWPGIYVSSTVVKVCVREIRHALGDEATQPQFIATVGAQGYRFIGSSTATTGIVPGLKLQVSSSESQGPSAKPEPIPRPPFSIPHFVGREQELAQLQSWYERTQQGEQHIVFVSGEAGIGKTTLVNRFLAQLPAKRAVRIGYGHCVEQDEQGEVYLPVLQALQQICRAPDGDQVAAGLRRYAPLWLVQLSGVIEADELEAFQRQIQGSKPQRMLREFGEALGILAAETGLILVFEDLQWSDVSTLELLTYLAQRRERARLLVIGTYRPAETVTSGHPLRRVVQELVGRGQCRELILELFTEAEVESYLTERLERSPAAATLSSVVYRRTDGNALFVAHFMDYLVRRGLLVEAGGRWELRAEPTAIEGLIPDHVQRLIARQIEGLSKDEQQLLEVASVVGMTFTASEVARVVNRPLEVAEAMYDDLANQGQLIEIKGIAEWPDGVITVRYSFRHALYQHVLYKGIGPARRVRWHRQIGEHFAAVYGGRAPEVAGELAVHFEQGRDYRRAVSYRQQAGEQALQQSAYQKALGHGWAGLALLVQLPAAAEHGHLELKLRQLVNVALAATRGYGDNDLEENLQRARQLCRELGDEAALVPVVVGLTRLHLFRANRAVTEELVKQENFLAERVHDAQLLVQLHTQLATTEMVRGRHARAADHYQQVRAHYDPQDRQLLWYSFAADPLVVAFGTSGVSVGLMGWPAQGWDRVAQGLVHAEGLAQGLTLAQALFYAAMMKNLRGERDEAWQFAQKMSALAREYELPLLARWSVLLQGGMAVQRGSAEEGVATITTALHEYRATGAQLLAPYFLSFLAEGYRQQGKIEEALQVVGEALSLTATNVDVFWEAELQRLKGTLTLQSHTTPRRATGKSKTGHRMPRAQTPEAEAEEWFLKAIEITRRQEAKLLELRAVMSLSRLWHRQGKKAEAYQLLSEIYRWFTEGFDTKDLREAEALLAEWS